MINYMEEKKTQKVAAKKKRKIVFKLQGCHAAQ